MPTDEPSLAQRQRPALSLRIRVLVYFAGALASLGWACAAVWLMFDLTYYDGVDPFESPQFYIPAIGFPVAVIGLTCLIRRTPRSRAIAQCARRGFLWSCAACVLVVTALIFSLGW